MNLSGEKKKVHLLGIKGAGMAALARILEARGMKVCGSDTQEVFFTDALLAQRNILIESIANNEIHSGVDAVIYSTAYPKNHPQIESAGRFGIPTMSYPQAVGALFNSAYGIAVCGSHGKTTTTAMVAHLFSTLGLDPTAIIGSTFQQTNVNYFAGMSRYWILEADEYQNKFSYYDPHVVVLTAVDYDHPDFFASVDAYKDVFRVFLAKQSCEQVIACIDDSGVRDVIASGHRQTIHTYGYSNGAEYQITRYKPVPGGGSEFDIAKSGKPFGIFSIRIPGRHNALNACGAIACLDSLGIGEVSSLRAALSTFPGTTRRFDRLGLWGKTVLIDDYAHHPTEIRSTLDAAREVYGEKKIWCCFGPHTYTRTTVLFDEFAGAFQKADHVLILDIYASAREGTSTFHASDLAAAIQAHSTEATYTGTIENTIAFLADKVHDIDILITMGAGDVYKIAERLRA
ncbi:UDP-N-acetylmuramate--L-alanine ligase [Candidatus Uhrbacteria bacterium]|nr:UDP-N-acetylmuramate--L-alanine ligase [Candidatus Uhrbacteria bacterium]